MACHSALILASSRLVSSAGAEDLGGEPPWGCCPKTTVPSMRVAKAPAKQFRITSFSPVGFTLYAPERELRMERAIAKSCEIKILQVGTPSRQSRSNQ